MKKQSDLERLKASLAATRAIKLSKMTLAQRKREQAREQKKGEG